MRGSQKGLTIVEVMIAMTVMTVTILSILTAIVSASRGNRNNMERTMALNLAVERMDQVKNKAYDDITAANFPSESGITVGTHPITFSRSVSITTTTYKTVTVTVTWTNFGGAYRETEEVSTIIGNA